MNLKSAAEMWSRLGSLYELKNPTSIYLLLQKFYKYEIAEGTSVAAHVAEIEAMARQLEDLGCKQSEVELGAKVLHSLPISYRHVTAGFDSLPQNDQTLANLLPRLLKEEMLNRGVNALNIKDDSGSSALYSKGTDSKGTGSDSQQHKKSKTKSKFTG
ncbi:copia, partial [Lasius niger]